MCGMKEKVSNLKRAGAGRLHAVRSPLGGARERPGRPLRDPLLTFPSPARHALLRTIQRQRFYLIVLLPFIAYALVFFYYPMYGVLIAFKNFSYSKGILGSPWAGLTYFQTFLQSADFGLVLRNTLAMSAMNLFLGFPIPIIFAILITEMRHRRYKRFVQTISYLPYFIAWIVITGMVLQLFSREGTVNTFLAHIGVRGGPINFLGASGPSFWVLIFLLNQWKGVGWNSIIYIAAISTINPELYEAATIDGAGKIQRVFRVTIPLIMPTAVLLFVLSLGYLLSAGFEQQLFLMNPLTRDFAEVVDTYVFKYGLQRFMFSYGAAVGLLKSFIALLLVISANAVMRRLTDSGVF
jgi:putative aldouronate transport system permease protein